MPFQIIRNDITRVKADAVVNTANPDPVIGGGTDSAVYQAAGAREMLEARRKIGSIAPGEARETPAFALNARYVIHTVGPVWIDGSHGEENILRLCYTRSLELAEKLGCTSIAFPMIATGVYGFPKEKALDIALSEIGKFLLNHEMNVTLVVFTRDSFELSTTRMGEIDSYIDEHTVRKLTEQEYGTPTAYHEQAEIRRRREIMRDVFMSSEESVPCESAAPTMRAPKSAARPKRRPMSAKSDIVLSENISDEAAVKLCADLAVDEDECSLDEYLSNAEDTFQQRLLKLIYDSGLDDVTVYKRANVDRKLFSFIRSHKEYRPKKQTAIAFGIALQLDISTLKDLLNRAGYALSPSSRGDLIISYFVSHKNYNIYEINAALFKYDEKILG